MGWKLCVWAALLVTSWSLHPRDIFLSGEKKGTAQNLFFKVEQGPFITYPQPLKVDTFYSAI